MRDEILLDFGRRERLGLDEAIFCAGKAPEHLQEILRQAEGHGAPLLLTRLSAPQYEALPAAQRALLDYEPLSRTAYLGSVPVPQGPAQVALCAAGTSDAFVTREVERVLRFYGHACSRFVDVGVAGLWRLLERLDDIRRHPVVIVVAGMDAALPTVMGGLVGSVLFAVPTSNGYGVAAGGETALRAVLASCAPGVAAFNIDNGYGAACAAVRVLHALRQAADSALTPLVR